MSEPRFLQIHWLASYTAALLNRDDSGLAKRLPYGGALRTRISSQCLKRHWRMADDPHALHAIDGAEAAVRSREIVTEKIGEVLRGRFSDEVAKAVTDGMQLAVYGDKGGTKTGRQVLMMGAPEIRWLTTEAERLAKEAGGDAAKATEQVKAWKSAYSTNTKALREATALPGGLTSALFGRMVTSDPEANITAPVHVAHAFTVHAEEAEADYFTAVDDLAGEDETGAGTIQETELTSGLYYGYAVVDLPGLVANLGGDTAMARQVLHNLIYLVAEVSPGAKLGSTAPYGRASFLLLEAGNRQPRSLAEAFRTPTVPHLGPAVVALAGQLSAFDVAYATGEARKILSLSNEALPGAEPADLAGLATWAGSLPGALVQGGA